MVRRGGAVTRFVQVCSARGTNLFPAAHNDYGLTDAGVVHILKLQGAKATGWCYIE